MCFVIIPGTAVFSPPIVIPSLQRKLVINQDSLVRVTTQVRVVFGFHQLHNATDSIKPPVMNSVVYDSAIQVVQSGGADSLFAFTAPQKLSVHVPTLHQLSWSSLSNRYRSNPRAPCITIQLSSTDGLYSDTVWLNNGRFGDPAAQVRVVDPATNAGVYRAALIAGLKHLRDNPDSHTADILVHDFVKYALTYCGSCLCTNTSSLARRWSLPVRTFAFLLFKGKS